MKIDDAKKFFSKYSEEEIKIKLNKAELNNHIKRIASLAEIQTLIEDSNDNVKLEYVYFDNTTFFVTFSTGGKFFDISVDIGSGIVFSELLTNKD